MTTGFYIERRVTNPDAIPAETELTGYGYCSPECAARHHILEEDIELQDIGNYEETDASLLMTSPDGGVRGVSTLLSDAINSIIEVKEESDIDSLFSPGGTSALNTNISGLDDFELICFLVVR